MGAGNQLQCIRTLGYELIAWQQQCSHLIRLHQLIKHYSFIIPAPVVALKDCWIVGDLFVSQIFQELPAKYSANRLAKLPPLYIYGNYTVKAYSTNPLTVKYGAIVRLVNALINGINANKYLPRIIIIAPDWDIVNQIKGRTGATDIFTVMEWVVTSMNRAIETRQDDLGQFTDGAVAYGEPKWLWVKMIDRVGVVDTSLAFRGKFNRALENVLIGRRAHYILGVNKQMANQNYFDGTGQLNGDGGLRYWLEINSILRDFDYQKKEVCEVIKPKKSHHRRKQSRRKSFDRQ